MDVFIGQRLTIRRLCGKHVAHTDDTRVRDCMYNSGGSRRSTYYRTFHSAAETCSVQPTNNTHLSYWVVSFLTVNKQSLTGKILCFHNHIFVIQEQLCVALWLFSLYIHIYVYIHAHIQLYSVFFPNYLPAMIQKTCPNMWHPPIYLPHWWRED